MTDLITLACAVSSVFDLTTLVAQRAEPVLDMTREWCRAAVSARVCVCARVADVVCVAQSDAPPRTKKPSSAKSKRRAIAPHASTVAIADHLLTQAAFAHSASARVVDAGLAMLTTPEFVAQCVAACAERCVLLGGVCARCVLWYKIDLTLTLAQ
jgi:hypothetical protein